jgi:hypothetical protein
MKEAKELVAIIRKNVCIYIDRNLQVHSFLPVNTEYVLIKDFEKELLALERKLNED